MEFSLAFCKSCHVGQTGFWTFFAACKPWMLSWLAVPGSAEPRDSLSCSRYFTHSSSDVLCRQKACMAWGWKDLQWESTGGICKEKPRHSPMTVRMSRCRGWFSGTGPVHISLVRLADPLSLLSAFFWLLLLEELLEAYPFSTPKYLGCTSQLHWPLTHMPTTSCLLFGAPSVPMFV